LIIGRAGEMGKWGIGGMEWCPLVKLQITKYKIQITNKVAPFGQVVNAFGEKIV